MRQKEARIGILAALAAVSLVLGPSAPARGQPKQPSAAAKDTARNLLIQCRKQFAEKNLEGALKSCQGAHAIMGVPSTGLELAKVQKARGQLVEARETALEVSRFDNAQNNPTFTQAQAEATTLAEELAKEIPSLVIDVQGPPKGAAIEVQVDAEAIPAAALSLPLRVNPGAHTVTASASGFAQARQQVEVKEGQTKNVTITVVPASAGGKADVRDPWSNTEEAREGSGRKIPVWAWVAGGVGLASAGAAVFSGLAFSDARSTVARYCPDNQCKPEVTPDAAAQYKSDWNLTLGLTVATSVVGAAGLGAAVYGIVTAPKADAKAARVVPWVGPGVSGLSALGQF